MNDSMKPVRLSLAMSGAALGTLLLTSCTVGPQYVKPSVPMTPAFKEQPPEQFQESKDWKPAQPSQPLPVKWWEVFRDPRLNALEEQVAPGNQDLKVAEAHFREARAMIRLNRSAQFPTITVGAAASSIRDSAHTPYLPSNVTSTGDFALPFDLSYEVDLWGRIRRTVAAAREETQASAADLASARLSIEAEVAFDYFELRSADSQKQLLDDTVNAYEDALRLTQNRFEGGASPKSDVAQAQTQLDSTRAQDTDIAVQRAQYEHAIAILLGKPPAAFNLPPAPLDLEPPLIPVGVPSQLLERRPDIAAAERRAEEANEQIGIARAAYFPTLTIGATAGLEGTSLLNWFTWPSRFWAVGPVVGQTLFDGGRRRAGSEIALANYDAVVATYRETTLTAFQQVEDNLAALRVLDREGHQQSDAVAAARESLQLFTNRYEGGVDNYLQVITAQTITLNNQRTAIDILRRRMDASVLLIKALGGGWDVGKMPQRAVL
jgi:NodT family efflux transporter outer membrane factor (OMF) lipoprotein